MRVVDQQAGSYAEFEAFVAGAAGRLLYVAVLLTGEPEAARRLLAGALARTYANWLRLRGDDPYDFTRQELCAAFARTGWRHHGGTGVLARLSPRSGSYSCCGSTRASRRRSRRHSSG